tara:strand:+ start:1715 stop:1999 length:285 start_codon:yes stop_codon:yes gene_type:complete
MPIVGLLSLELHIPHSRSLKEKRVVIRSIKDRLNKLSVGFAEVNYQDLLQRTALAVVAVGAEQQLVEQSLANVVKEVEKKGDGVVVRSEIEWLA